LKLSTRCSSGVAAPPAKKRSRGPAWSGPPIRSPSRASSARGVQQPDPGGGQPRWQRQAVQRGRSRQQSRRLAGKPELRSPPRPLGEQPHRGYCARSADEQRGDPMNRTRPRKSGRSRPRPTPEPALPRPARASEGEQPDALAANQGFHRAASRCGLPRGSCGTGSAPASAPLPGVASALRLRSLRKPSPQKPPLGRSQPELHSAASVKRGKKRRPRSCSGRAAPSWASALCGVWT